MDFYIIILNKYKFIFYKIKLIFNYKNLYSKFDIKNFNKKLSEFNFN